MEEQVKPQILVVDDDGEIRLLLMRFLGDHGFDVREASDGTGLISAVAARRPDLIVLDVMMPGEDGFSLCRRLREQSGIPIILLTARTGDTDKVVGLEIGADDYVPKPFNPRELVARIRAVLRRTPTQSPNDTATSQFSGLYRFAGWVLDVTRRSLTSPDDVRTDLTTGEFDLLTALVQNPQRPLSRDQLLDLVHGRVSYHFDRSIDVQISRLRRKIEPDPQHPILIKTIRNEGYFFAVPVDTGGDAT